MTCFSRTKREITDEALSNRVFDGVPCFISLGCLLWSRPFLLSICTLIYNGVGKFCAHGFCWVSAYWKRVYLLRKLCRGENLLGGGRSWGTWTVPNFCKRLTGRWFSGAWKASLVFSIFGFFLLIYQVETETSLILGNKPRELIVEGEDWWEERWEPVQQPSYTLSDQCCERAQAKEIPIKEKIKWIKTKRLCIGMGCSGGGCPVLIDVS